MWSFLTRRTTLWGLTVVALAANIFLPGIIFAVDDPWGCGGCFRPQCPSMPPWLAISILGIFIAGFFAVLIGSSMEEKKAEAQREIDQVASQEAARRKLEEEEAAKQEWLRKIEGWTNQYGWHVGEDVTFTLHDKKKHGVVVTQEADTLNIHYLTDSGNLASLQRKIGEVVFDML